MTQDIEAFGTCPQAEVESVRHPTVEAFLMYIQLRRVITFKRLAEPKVRRRSFELLQQSGCITHHPMVPAAALPTTFCAVVQRHCFRYSNDYTIPLESEPVFSISS